MKLPKFVPETVLVAGTLVEVSSAITQQLDFVNSGKVGIVFYGVVVLAAVLSLCAGLYILNRSRTQREPILEAPSNALEFGPGESAAVGQVTVKSAARQRSIGCTVTAGISLTALSILVITSSALRDNFAEHGTAASPATSIAPPTTVSATPPVTNQTVTAPGPAAAFTKPASGAPIRAGSSIEVAGTAVNLDGGSLWLMTKPEAGGGGYYYTDGSPVTIRDGAWWFIDTGVGDNTDIGKNITYEAILADPACSRYLTANSTNDSVDRLAAGCTVLATVTVHVGK